MARSSDADLRVACKRFDSDIEPDAERGLLINALFEACVEPELIQPTFITDYPIAVSPLAKRHRTQKDLTERFEFFINGWEAGNAFSELNDPIDQRQRFAHQKTLRDRGDDEAQILDEDFFNGPGTRDATDGWVGYWCRSNGDVCSQMCLRFETQFCFLTCALKRALKTMDELLRATGVYKHYVLGDTHIEVLKGVDLGVVRGENCSSGWCFGCRKEYFVAHYGRVRSSGFGDDCH